MNNRGFSLIELLIAVVFIAISMLALATSITYSMRTNLENDIRNTAVRVTNQTAEALMALGYDDTQLNLGGHERISGDSAQNALGLPDPYQTVRESQVKYTIKWNVTQTGNSKQVIIIVSYDFRGRTFTNESTVTKAG